MVKESKLSESGIEIVQIIFDQIGAIIDYLGCVCIEDNIPRRRFKLIKLKNRQTK